MLFRRRAKQAHETPAPPPVPAAPPEAQPPDDGARELVFSIMRAAPDLRFRAARELGLLEGADAGGGPEFERLLLERARDTRTLAALERAIPR